MQDCTTSTPSRVLLDSSICPSPRPSTSAGNTKARPPVATKYNTRRVAKTIKKKVAVSKLLEYHQKEVVVIVVVGFTVKVVKTSISQAGLSYIRPGSTEKETPSNKRHSSKLAVKERFLEREVGTVVKCLTTLVIHVISPSVKCVQIAQQGK
ncbi:hypothetical protein OS493_034019 [Desmophyllum pertusum]|uniref:Uncharacterized protein n=1 Tax=Desmophyllum pertusum TaxID=174260 RepID=A0A9W9Z7A3_9CNID|nr:hypothetical protein OS493_034019 [Desmophyllum pertusum]